jgi:hypothetical protein
MMRQITLALPSFAPVSTIESNDTTPMLYSHRATSFEHEGVSAPLGVMSLSQ